MRLVVAVLLGTFVGAAAAQDAKSVTDSADGSDREAIERKAMETFKQLGIPGGMQPDTKAPAVPPPAPPPVRAPPAPPAPPVPPLPPTTPPQPPSETDMAKEQEMVQRAAAEKAAEARAAEERAAKQAAEKAAAKRADEDRAAARAAEERMAAEKAKTAAIKAAAAEKVAAQKSPGATATIEQDPDVELRSASARHLSHMTSSTHHNRVGAWLYGDYKVIEGLDNGVACAAECEADAKCHHWNFNVLRHVCDLKVDNGHFDADKSDWITGNAKRWPQKEL